jgi:hypothetical protein
LRKRTTLSSVGVALAAVAATVPASAVPAAKAPVSDPIVENLAGPLQIDVNRHGIAVGQSFALTVSKVRRNGNLKNLVTETGNPERGADIAGVALTKRGVVYTLTRGERGVAKLKFVSNEGDVRTLADLAAFENDVNPDGVQTYGFRNLTPECEAEFPEEFPASYPGIVESHPYAIAKAPKGWYVADAAGNSIVKVSRSGKVGLVATLKPQGVVVSAEQAAEFEMPECVAGEKYFFEPVPTDVEVADNGKLIVSLLPGGPEDDSLGARGAVVRVDPKQGTSREVADGFLGATNVALNGAGRIFVANLGSGTISKVTDAGTRVHAELPLPAGLEWYQGKLYTSYNVFGPGSISTIG